MIRYSLPPLPKHFPRVASARRVNLPSIRNTRILQTAHSGAWRAGEFQEPQLPCPSRFPRPGERECPLRRCRQSCAPMHAWLGWRHGRSIGRCEAENQAPLPIEDFRLPELPFHLLIRVRPGDAQLTNVAILFRAKYGPCPTLPDQNVQNPIKCLYEWELTGCRQRDQRLISTPGVMSQVTTMW